MANQTFLSPRRPVHLRFKADWGHANLTRACGWLAGEVWKRTAPESTAVIHSGTACVDNLLAVDRGEVDVALTTPAAFARMATEGKGPFAGEPLPSLRAIGTLPHFDALLLGLPADLGIRTMADLREKKPVLHLSTTADAPTSFVGLAVSEALRESGVPTESLLAWGGSIVEGVGPSECVAAVVEGRANSIFFEGIMIQPWHDLTNSHELVFLSLEPDVLDRLEQRFSWPAVIVEAGYMRGIEEPVRTIDFSGWLLVAREELRADIAHLLAAIMTESKLLEAQYRLLPPERSALSYPITAEKLADSPIPLHPGAAAYYASVGAI